MNRQVQWNPSLTDPTGQDSLDQEARIGLIVLWSNAQAGIHKNCEDRMHWADVVQHVAVPHDHAHDEDEEVQSPHHLAEPGRGQVGGCGG